MMRILRISESSADFQIQKRSNKKIYMKLNNCFDAYCSLISRTFYKFGHLVAKYPSYFIIIPVFLSILGLSGFQRLVYESDGNYLFFPTDGESKLTRDKIENLFPVNSSNLFDPSRITRATYFAKIYSSAKDGGTMFRRKVWADVQLLDELIQNITVEWDNRSYRYKDLCSKWSGECFRNNIFNLNKLIPEIEDGRTMISYPIMLFPFVLPMFFGSPKVNESEGIMTEAKALFTTYWLSKDTEEQRQRAHAWEGKLLELLSGAHFETIHVDRFASRSIPDEMKRNSARASPFLPFAILLLIGFGTASVASPDCVRSKLHLGFVGVFTILLGVCGGFGLLMYIGVPFIGVNTAAVFLILGIGLDNMFVMLSAWSKTRIQDAVEDRLAKTYSTSAVSLCVTSLTNILAFFIGSFTSFPGVRIFCIYIGVAVLVTFVWFLTMFGAILSLTGRQEKSQRHSLFCCTLKSVSEAGKESFLYRAFCTGGINPLDPWNAADNRPGRVELFLREVLANFLTKRTTQVCVLLMYVAYLGGAIYGCSQVKAGLEPKCLSIDSSYLQSFYDIENENFRKFPYRIQVLVQGNISYHKISTRKKLIQLHRELEKLPHVGPGLYTRSWIRGFFSYLRRNQDLKENITDETSFISILKKDFMTPVMKEKLDVVFNEDNTRIVASRFIIQGYEVRDFEEDKEMMKAFKRISENAPFQVSFYHPTFALYDQFLEVRTTVMKVIVTATFISTVVFFIFVPRVLSSLLVGASSLSVLVGVVGFMSLWNVRLDSISLINLIMAIGYSIDFSGHVVYTYATSKFKCSDEKMAESVFNIGLPILQSGFSTIFGVILFLFVPSYVYRTFFKVVFLVSVLGMLHSLIILPVILTLSHKIVCKLKIRSSDVSKRNINGIENTSSFKRTSSDVQNEQTLSNDQTDQDLNFKDSFFKENNFSGSKSNPNESLRSSSGSSGYSSEENMKSTKSEENH